MEPFFAVAGHWRNARVLFFLFQVPERSIEYEAAHSKNSDWLLDGNFPQGWTVKRSVWNYLSHEIKSSLFLFHVFCWFWWYLKKNNQLKKIVSSRFIENLCKTNCLTQKKGWHPCYLFSIWYHFGDEIWPNFMLNPDGFPCFFGGLPGGTLHPVELLHMWRKIDINMLESSFHQSIVFQEFMCSFFSRI